MRIAPSFFVLLVPLVVACQESAVRSSLPDQGSVADPSDPLPLGVLIDDLHLDAKTIRFRVDKSDRHFGVLVEDSLLRIYPCVLGDNPVGDKMMQGDRRTPEGTFGFRSKRVHDKWHAFVWVDYPNAESKKRFERRKRDGLIPPGKDIGGEIGIHGVPDGMDHWITEGEDWTWGCIALRNADLDEIYPFIIAGVTTIIIEP